MVDDYVLEEIKSHSWPFENWTGLVLDVIQTDCKMALEVAFLEIILLQIKLAGRRHAHGPCLLRVPTTRGPPEKNILYRSSPG